MLTVSSITSTAHVEAKLTSVYSLNNFPLTMAVAYRMYVWLYGSIQYQLKCPKGTLANGEDPCDIEMRTQLTDIVRNEKNKTYRRV